MNEREYNRLKSEIEAEYRRKLEALEMVWKMAGGPARDGTRETGMTLTTTVPAGIGKGMLLKAVRNALTDIHGDFTLRDVEKRIHQNNPSLAAALKRPSLSSALKRLEKDGFITLVAVGSGKRPSKYRRGSVAAG